MSTFALLILCIQACLFQNVYGKCCKNIGAFGSNIEQGLGHGSSLSQIYGPSGLKYQAENIIQEYAYNTGYGGNGVGEVYANGELPVEGYTSVAGQVPIIGVVSFDGPVQAKGIVSISGRCGCGCQF